MNAAEYDTRRRALGLSVRDLAELHGCTERTVNRRLAGEQEVRDRDIDDLDRLEREMDKAVDEALARAKSLKFDGPITLFRYRNPEHFSTSSHVGAMPPGSHAMLISWVADALEAKGYDVEIDWAT